MGVRADRATLRIRRRIAKWALLAAGALVAATLLVQATAHAVDGIGQGLTLAFGGRSWLGELTTGVLLLAAMGAATAIVLSRRKSKELAEHIAKYERLHAELSSRKHASSDEPRAVPRPRAAPR
jgi:hypothetical protein